jgi:hypothetical protein
MMVGFSGESSQVPVVISPPWAWSGRAAEKHRAKPRSRESFFMGCPLLGRYGSPEIQVNERKVVELTLLWGGYSVFFAFDVHTTDAKGPVRNVAKAD